MAGVVQSFAWRVYKFVRQERIDPYCADFACCEAPVVVGIGGATHSTERALKYNERRRISFARRDIASSVSPMKGSPSNPTECSVR